VRRLTAPPPPPAPPLPTLHPYQLLPTEEGFQPEAYLAVFHEGTSAAQLAAGSRALERELGEGAGQLKQLVGGRAWWREAVACGRVVGWQLGEGAGQLKQLVGGRAWWRERVVCGRVVGWQLGTGRKAAEAAGQWGSGRWRLGGV
jgi:hypothetical protein